MSEGCLARKFSNVIPSDGMMRPNWKWSEDQLVQDTTDAASFLQKYTEWSTIYLSNLGVLRLNLSPSLFVPSRLSASLFLRPTPPVTTQADFFSILGRRLLQESNWSQFSDPGATNNVEVERCKLAVDGNNVTGWGRNTKWLISFQGMLIWVKVARTLFAPLLVFSYL